MGRLERAYAVVGIVYYDQGIILALRSARGAEALKPGSSDIMSTIVQFAILATLLVILLVRRRVYMPIFRHVAPYLVILALSFVSVLWSDNPLPTARRSISLASCVLFGLYLCQTLGLRGAIRMVGQCSVFLGLLSVAVFVAVPKIGRETAAGYETAMRGVFSQKNPMAECMLLGVSCYCFRLLDEGRRLTHFAALLVLLACIALARSATSLGIAAVVLVVTGFMATRGWPRLRLMLCFGTGWTVLALVTFAVVSPESLMALSGRDTSLTGRGPLWHEVMHVIAQRPLLGHGYAGFWNGDSKEVQFLWLQAGWEAPDSHDGYLDVLVELGIVGLVAYLFMWGRVTARAFGAQRSGSLREVRWVLLFMLINVLLNLDEGPMPYSNGFTMLMPGALLALGVWHGRQRIVAALEHWQPAPPQARYAG
jgi:exopolysaccharide production protein ExoQ